MFNILQSILPILTTILAVLLTNLPFLNKFAYVDLVIPLIIFWIVRKPEMMWFIYIFILGIIADVISNVKLGIHSFVYLMIWVTYLYFAKQQLTKTLIGINVVATIIILLSYIYYGLFAYINNSLQILALSIGALFTILISILFNMILFYKTIR